MKGPRSRHKFYIARVWECPQCKKRSLSEVQAVNHACGCGGPGGSPWMSLIEESRVKKSPLPITLPANPG